MQDRGEDAGADRHGERCAASVSALVPTIWLVLDGSGSMDDPLSGMTGDKSRFDSLKEALMDTMTGVVKKLEHDVSWGYIMFDGPGGSPARADGGSFSSGPAMTCPRIVSVEPKLDNYNDIAAMYPPDPLGGSTPTDKALNVVVQHIPMTATPQGDAKVHPTIAVFATDGAPNNLCEGANPFDDVRPAVLDQVSKLAQANIKTYVISLAGQDQMLMQHLQQVAEAGMSGKPPFTPQNAGELLTALQTIALQDALCTFQLSGRVKPMRGCDAEIELSGSKLTCNAADGFGVENPSTLKLLGNACTRYKAEPSALRVEFPCDALEAP